MTTTCLIFENDTDGGGGFVIGGFVIGGFVIGGFVIDGWEPPPHAIRIANAQILQKTATARAPLVSRPMIENPPGRSPRLKMLLTRRLMPACFIALHVVMAPVFVFIAN
jgi:hypothetical protein